MRNHNLSLGDILKWGALALVVAGFVAYAFFQARYLLAGPKLTLDERVRTAYTTRSLLVTGTAENVTEITLNDRPILTDQDGRFSELLVLPDGYTIMTLRARGRYGRKITVTHPFVYAPAYTTSPTTN